MKASIWNVLTVIPLSLALSWSCSKDESEDTGAGKAASPYTYDDVKAIVNGTCATTDCHAAGSPNKPMTSLAEIKLLPPSKMVTRIRATDSTRMPPLNTAFEASADGVKFLNWLEAGADLK